MPSAPSLSVVVLLSLSACSSSGAPTRAAPDGGSDVAVGDPNQPIGGFDLVLVPATPATKETAAVPALTSLLGRVRSGPVPSPLAWKQAMQEDLGAGGSCRLLTPVVPFCNPACVSPDVCVEGGTCAPSPTARSAGTVTITGLHAASGPFPVTVMPDPPSYIYQLPTGVQLAYPPFSPGDPVTLTGGGDLGSFTITAGGISPLVPTAPAVTLEMGKPLALAWSPPTSAEGGSVHVALDLSVHGGSRGRIECDLPDRGALQIGAALTGALTALGTAGYPSVVITRTATSSASTPAGTVKLDLVSEVRVRVTIPGQISCVDATDCPAGQACQANQLCR